MGAVLHSILKPILSSIARCITGLFTRNYPAFTFLKLRYLKSIVAVAFTYPTLLRGTKGPQW
jgi:hypothetical protein